MDEEKTNNPGEQKPDDNKDDNKGFSFEELQKQIQNALKNIGGNNSFIIPISPQKPPPGPQKPPEQKQKEDADKVLEIIKNFNFKPKEIKEYLDRYVIKQDEAKRVLSVAVCDHYNNIRRCLSGSESSSNPLEYVKQNILLLGPTGVGKTYLVKCLASLIGVPFVKADATKYSATGYVGGNVEDLVRDLVKIADSNSELAQYGIIYIDEIDKIASLTVDDGKDVSGKGVQINLLKIMEDSEVNLVSQTDMFSQFESVMDMMHGKGGKNKKRTINTKNILFIVSGAFEGLTEIIKKRSYGTQIGFGKEGTTNKSKSAYLKEAGTADFIKYGFEPEFIGRLPVRVACEELEPEDLELIMTSSEGSILRQYISDFDGYGIKFSLDREAIAHIAKEAHKQQTGARGIMTVIEKIFRNFKYELPSIGVTDFNASHETVTDPEASLKKIIFESTDSHYISLKNDIDKFVQQFAVDNAVILKFNKQAEKVLIDEAISSGKTIYTLCSMKFKDYPYGLKLISGSLEGNTLNVTAKMIKDPDKELSAIISDFYKKNGN
ncbi:MAG TPA: ATP-dependent protease [Lentisphaeria bacterium]|nr:MAG: hypothetical protein A2X47_06115 [Lentisphaerae bacterium GWF2_38_69]HBM15747.1 ATP-dependent protease [Lentisphaeria bacterium]